MEDETGPEIGRVPALALTQLVLGLPESGGRGKTVNEEATVERRHQLGGGFVVDLPEAHYQAGRSSVEKAVGEADETGSVGFGRQGGLAGAQDDEVGGEIEGVDLVQTEVAIDGLAGGVEHGEGETGEIGLGLVEETVGRKVDDAVVPQVTTTDPLGTGVEAEDGQGVGLVRPWRGELPLRVASSEGAKNCSQPSRVDIASVGIRGSSRV